MSKYKKALIKIQEELWNSSYEDAYEYPTLANRGHYNLVDSITKIIENTLDQDFINNLLYGDEDED